MFRVPKKTSTWKLHTNSDALTLTFAPELIKFVKDKRKSQTFRLAHEKYASMKTGNILTIKQTHVDKPVGKARITNVKKVAFAQLPYTKLARHESYKDKEHQRKVFSGYYAFLGREIRDNDKFYIIDFELLD